VSAMQDLGGIGPAIVIALLIVVMLWFTLGTQRNIRKGNHLLVWLQEDLPRIGPRTTLRWLGSSAVELTIVEPREPFRTATVVLVLEPRDVGLLWAFARSRGRRDFIIFRANLRRPPRFSADVGDPHGWTGRLDNDDGDLRRTVWPDGAVAVLDAGADHGVVRQAWRQLAEATGGVWRLTIQPVVPHLEIHVRPPSISERPSEPLVTTIVDLATELATR
jgi:hypothetical protein